MFALSLNFYQRLMDVLGIWRLELDEGRDDLDQRHDQERDQLDEKHRLEREQLDDRERLKDGQRDSRRGGIGGL